MERSAKRPPLKHIPSDLIIENILPRLPVKSLLRFTSVSKTWYSHIKTPKLISTHLSLNLSEAKGECLLILDIDSCYILDKDTFTELARFRFQIDLNVYQQDIKSCNGLLLLIPKVENRHRQQFLMWNPTIRKFKKFESKDCKPSFKNDGTLVTHEVHGMGFHDSTNDHRVIRIVYAIEDRTSNVANHVQIEVDVYSLSADSWRSILSSPNGLIAVDRPAVSLNGAIHWFASTSLVYRGTYFESILVFDFGNECFREMRFPRCQRCTKQKLVGFSEFKGSLAVLLDRNVIAGRQEYHFWVMAQYGVSESWMKRCSIRLDVGQVPDVLIKGGILVFVEKKEQGFSNMFEDSQRMECFIMNNIDRGQSRSIGIFRSLKGLIVAINLVESLVLLE